MWSSTFGLGYRSIEEPTLSVPGPLNPGMKDNRGWRVGQPGSMVVVVSESRTARHARFVSADLELSQDRPPTITGLRDLRQDRSFPRICDASRARPSSGKDVPSYSRAWGNSQEQNKNMCVALPHPSAGRDDPRSVMAGLVPAIHVLSRVEAVDPWNKSGDDVEG
jgi:hypothetical protein